MANSTVKGVIITGALLFGVIFSLGLGLSTQTGASSPSTSTINELTSGSAYTTVTEGSNISFAACNSQSYVLNVLPAALAQPQVKSAMAGYTNWVEQVVSNGTGNYSNSNSGVHYFSDTQIDIDSLQANSPVQCNPPENFVNIQLAVIIPLVNGKYNVTGVKVVVTGPVVGTATANSTGV